MIHSDQMEKVQLWLETHELGSHADVFEAAGYDDLEYIASITLDDAKIVAEEELGLDSNEQAIFLREYQSCAAGAPENSNIKGLDLKQNAAIEKNIDALDLESMITQRDEVGLQSAVIKLMRQPNDTSLGNLVEKAKVGLDLVARLNNAMGRLVVAIKVGGRVLMMLWQNVIPSSNVHFREEPLMKMAMKHCPKRKKIR